MVTPTIMIAIFLVALGAFVVGVIIGAFGVLVSQDEQDKKDCKALFKSLNKLRNTGY